MTAGDDSVFERDIAMRRQVPGAAPADLGPGAVVGFIGLGMMGAPMATRLAEAGYQVQGYDVRQDTARNWAERVGASPAATLAASAAGAAAAILVGDVGAGHAVKALNNLLSATHLLATSEAMAAAAEFGLDVPTVLEAINAGSGRSGSTENKWPNFIVPRTFDSGFSLRLMLKDMRIALGLAESAGTRARLSAAAAGLWAEAAEALGGDADHTEIARWLDPDRFPPPLAGASGPGGGSELSD